MSNEPEKTTGFRFIRRTIIILVLAGIPALIALVTVGLGAAVACFLLICAFGVIYAILAKNISNNYKAEGGSSTPVAPSDGF